MTKETTALKGELVTQKKPVHPYEIVKTKLIDDQAEYIKALPSHISFDKFQRTVMTAIMMNPDLLQADRISLFSSCLKSAQDGLLPDSRDAALVIFNAKVKTEEGDRWIKKVQYMPMYTGILKKVRQSKELASVITHVVYQKDKFEYVLGDDERILHVPYMGAEDRGEIIAAYSIVKLKDGSVVREVMTKQDIEKVRKVSKSGNDDKGEPKGIWKSWYEEMARKTVFRRIAKWLPQSIEIAEAFSRDDSMQITQQVEGSTPFLIENQSAGESVDEETGEITTEKKPDQPDLTAEIAKKKAEDDQKKADTSKTPMTHDMKKDAVPPQQTGTLV